jgi:hypothetical protein
MPHRLGEYPAIGDPYSCIPGLDEYLLAYCAASMLQMRRALESSLTAPTRCCHGPGSRRSVRQRAASKLLHAATVVTLCASRISATTTVIQSAILIAKSLGQIPPFIPCQAN